ncbi:MAG: hypothetical protein LBH18_02790 [Spirochaetaceae bacterium]|jgi:hypothetical protein|nr:hypothetical protein [Spirochaetaceae bacterium]
MPRYFRRRIDTDSPAFISFAYTFAALVLLLLFRLFFPNVSLYDNGLPADVLLSSKSFILGVFRTGNSLTRGLLDFISFFPAVFISSQLISFSRAVPQENVRYRSFSPEFFKMLRPRLITALVAAVLYGILFLIVRPLAAGYQVDIQTGSLLFNEAKEKAILFADREDWKESSRFLSICERIWPRNPELAGLRESVDMGLTRLMYSRGPDSDKPAGSADAGMRGDPIDAQSALRLTETALSEERFYDAHRLAVIAERLSVEGSNEAALAKRLAGTSWNAIETLEPDAAERERRSIYQRKKEGYEAMISGDWVHAYYTFRALLDDAPSDPDIRNFFDISTEGLGKTAFFIDEMERLGTEISDPLFSLPLFETDGRLVMRLASFSGTGDYSYGKGLDIAAFDANHNPLFRVSTPYVKFMPFYVDGKQYTVIYLQAWGRNYEQMHWEPVWEGTPPANTPQTQLALAISYDDFLLASAAGRNLDGFFIRDIWLFANRLASYGYVPEVYQAEIIYIVSEPLFFFPLAIFSLVISWNLRGRSRAGAKSRGRVSFVVYPMLIALPFALNWIIHMMRGVMNMFGIFTLLSFGFWTGMLISLATAFTLFALGIVIMAAQSD